MYTQPKTLQLHPLNTSRDLDPTIARVLNDHDNHYSTLLAETKVRRNPFSSMTPALAIVQKEHTLLRSSVDSPSILPTDSFGPESFSRSCINKISTTQGYRNEKIHSTVKSNSTGIYIKTYACLANFLIPYSYDDDDDDDEDRIILFCREGQQDGWS